MDEILEIRPARDADAEAISAVIVRALSEVNARDYPIDAIADMVAGAAPEGVRARLAARTVLVAVAAGEVVGTAGLERTPKGAALRSLYVRPDVHGRGIGSRLLHAVEDLARARGDAVLLVPASITAETFYLRHGYAPTGGTAADTIPMFRRLA